MGNPPFAGKNTIAEGSPEGILDWFKQLHPESHGNADLVAHFFRRTEPHSPVAYLAEKAVKWGEMPLHDQDGGALGHAAAPLVRSGDQRPNFWCWMRLGMMLSAPRRRILSCS